MLPSQISQVYAPYASALPPSGNPSGYAVPQSSAYASSQVSRGAQQQMYPDGRTISVDGPLGSNLRQFSNDFVAAPPRQFQSPGHFGPNPQVRMSSTVQPAQYQGGSRTPASAGPFNFTASMPGIGNSPLLATQNFAFEPRNETPPPASGSSGYPTTASGAVGSALVDGSSSGSAPVLTSAAACGALGGASSAEGFPRRLANSSTPPAAPPAPVAASRTRDQADPTVRARAQSGQSLAVPRAGEGAPDAAEKDRERETARAHLCRQAFTFVDGANKTGRIGMSANKTALTMVFEQLGDVPMPKDEWYVRVFQNFVSNEAELLDFRKFVEIVVQWDEHHLQKKKMRAEKQGTTEVEPIGEGQKKIIAVLPPPPTRASSGQSSGAASQHKSPSHEAGSAVSGASAGTGANTPSSAASDAEDEKTGTPAGHHALPLAGERTGPAQDLQQPSRAKTCPEIPAKALKPPPSDPIDDLTAASRAKSTKSTATRNSAADLSEEVMFPTYVGRLAIFDDYEFFGDVGSGSFGKVMVVRHKLTKQLRACKVVQVQTALQRDLIDTEIKLLKSLNHPNIMKMHEVYFEQPGGSNGGVANGNIYLVTELCEGGDLFSRILHHYERLQQPMTESHVAFMMKQILSATKYCHDKGIIHRDIKPENILFVDRSSSSALKIIDFGLANFTEHIRETAKEMKIPRSGTIGRLARMLPSVNGKHLIPYHERKKVMQKAGTPHYMAPEMIEGFYDHQADLFSIGIILCQLFTGWHPFYAPGDDEQAVRAKISLPDPVVFPGVYWDSVSKEALQLCQKLLEKDPAKRLTADQALAHAWFQDPAKPSPFGNVSGLSVSIFEGLMQYQAYNKLKRAVLQLLTRELSEYQIQELRKKFMALDTEGDGMLSAEELLTAMRHVGYEMSSADLEQLMDSLDGTGSQRIGYKEFISALIERRVKFDRQQLLECFNKFDKQKTGKITYNDVKSAMAGQVLTECEWLEIVQFGSQIDGGGTETPELTFEQFVLLMDQDG